MYVSDRRIKFYLFALKILYDCLYLQGKQNITDMKPFVIIELQPHLHDFLYHEFGCDKKEDGVFVSTKNDIGKFIQAMVTITDRPAKQELKDNPIKLYLPIQEWNHFILAENFIYVPEWKQYMIQDYIEASFRLRIREFFQSGYEVGHKQDIIIKSFLAAYNIKNNTLNYDTIKKYDYRNRQRVIKEVKKEISIQLSLFG